MMLHGSLPAGTLQRRALRLTTSHKPVMLQRGGTPCSCRRRGEAACAARTGSAGTAMTTEAAEVKLCETSDQLQHEWPPHAHGPARSAADTSTSGSTANPATAVDSPRSKYNWLQHWWPVLSVEMLHKDKPNAVTILGRQLVVWWDQPQAQWVVMEDSCPHRLTPLSQGRIVSPGQLTCSYHGWSFNAKGSCTTIPHLPADQPTTSKRSCVRTYPSQVVDGLLFTWLDTSPEGLQLSRSKAMPLTDDQGTSIWAVLEAPGECRFWLHQVFDPAHANFLHVGVGFDSNNAVPMEVQPVTDLTLEGGFTMRHGGYEKKNVGLKGQRRFEPPYTVRVSYQYPGGLQGTGTLLFVPVRPSFCRTFVSFKPEGFFTAAAAGASAGGVKGWAMGVAKGLVRQAAKVPHWLYLWQKLTDQDVVAMYSAERAMWERGQTDRDFFLASPADVGVAAVNKWLRLAGGYEGLWGAPLQGPPDLSLEQLLDRRTRHVDHCAVCQKGLRTVEKLASVLKALTFTATAAAAGLGASATSALATGGSGGSAAVLAAVAAGVAVVLALLMNAVDELKVERFESGAPAWRRSGGLSLVPRK